MWSEQTYWQGINGALITGAGILAESWQRHYSVGTRERSRECFVPCRIGG